MMQIGKLVTLTLYSLPQSGNPQPSARRIVKQEPLGPKGPVHLKNLSLYDSSTQPAASAPPFFICGEASTALCLLDLFSFTSLSILMYNESVWKFYCSWKG